MFIKLIGGFGILATAGLLVTACGEEPAVDAGANVAVPPIVEQWDGYPVTADGAIRRELAQLEAERASAWGDWPVTADGAIRRELARLEAERASVWGDWPVTADGAIRRELARLEAERAGD
jgi:hypothetical protein